YMFHLMD
uniref:[D-Met2]-deltorphin n=1 Tax=Phasmahyla jandaia TaxID=762504 RepID=DELT_PHAJA|nr:RecName: Full=[D-Met2]-deltorphin [Phasmahyla jandaia]